MPLLEFKVKNKNITLVRNKIIEHANSPILLFNGYKKSRETGIVLSDADLDGKGTKDEGIYINAKKWAEESKIIFDNAIKLFAKENN